MSPARSRGRARGLLVEDAASFKGRAFPSWVQGRIVPIALCLKHHLIYFSSPSWGLLVTNLG